MAYGRSYNRRRLGGKSVSYASTMGLRPMPFKRKRKGPPTTTGGGATIRLGRRVRPRMANSYTFTKTQTKRRAGRVTSHGDNQSASVNTIGKRWMSCFDKLMSRKIISPQSSFKNASSQLNAAQGVQYVEPFSFLGKTDLVAMETLANGAGTNIPVKFFLKTGKYTLKVRNATNTNVKMSIYDIVTKRNTVETGLDNPKECWQKGLTDFGGTPALTTETVGFTPYRSPEFNQYFGVNRVTTVSLEPGQQHDHIVYHKYNRVVDSIQFQNNVGLSIAGLTRWCMIVFHGTLVHDQTGGSQVTYSQARVDVAQTSEISFGWIEKTARSFVSTDIIPKGIATVGGALEAGDVDANVIMT